MFNQSAQSGHWTDDQLIDHLYGVGPADGHLPGCKQCHARFAALEVRFKTTLAEPVSDEFLAAQRRAIYARLSGPHSWWNDLPVRKLAAAAAMLLVLAGSVTFYESRQQRELAEARADVQLAQDASRMCTESEPLATAPLKGLFVE